MDTGRINKCLELIKSTGLKNKSVLDIGCSGGWMYDQSIRMGAKSYVGIDTNKPYLTTAKKAYPKGDFRLASAIKLPFKAASFDVILAFDILEHIPSNTEQQMFDEMARVLKPKGRVLLSTPLNNPVSTLLDVAWYFGHRHYLPTDLQFFSAKAALKVDKLLTGGGLWETFGLLNLYAMKWIFKRDMILKNLFETKRNQEYKKPGFVSLFLVASKKA